MIHRLCTFVCEHAITQVTCDPVAGSLGEQLLEVSLPCPLEVQR
jgi:hypothetical protein